MKPTYAREIVRKLREQGHEAYFVGGCVRDMVMGIEPADYDIATSARPEAIMKLFRRTEPVGARFGVVLVIHRGVPFEVATFRSDEAYIDGRRPSGVVFTDSRKDVERRDFTINGLLYDPLKHEVIDHVGGRSDIEKRIVRAIGDPHERFAEDKLRILRAVRFGARLGYTIEGRTWDAVRAMTPEIHQVSVERIRQELERLLTEGGAARGGRMLHESGLLAEIVPEVEWTDHLERCLGMIPAGASADFAFGVLLHECTGAEAARVLRRLKASRAEIEHARALVAGQPRIEEARRLPQSRLKRVLRTERIEDHLELHRIHCAAAELPLDDWEYARDRLREWGERDLRPEPLISGEDLISLGLDPGPSFKKILTAVEDEQLEERLADRADALDFVRRRFLENSR